MRSSSKITSNWPCPPGFNGRLAGMYRWLSGRPMNGHRYTDATFLRYGTMATDISGHASAYQLWPGWKRLAYVRLPVMASPALAAAELANPWTVPWLLAIGSTLATPRAVRLAKVRGHRKLVIEPLAKALAKELAKRHVDGQGWTWVDVPLDIRDNPLATVTVQLPVNWTGVGQGERARLARIVASRLAMEDPVATFDVVNGRPVATFGQPAKPPAKVDFTDMVTVDTPDTELAMGMGPNGKLVTFSLTAESPHLAIAGGTGAGKSELLAWLVGTLLRRGYGGAFLDAKFTSHMWARRIPGVLYASENEELHEALVWLDGELLRRARFVAAGGDPSTLVPLVVVMEEMNGASNRLRAHWRTVKEPGEAMMSPALTALGNLSSMGRELRMHILMAGQSLTSKAVGGPENRENFGGRALARATAAQWKMLAPQIKPAPVKRQASGRWHLVVGDALKEFQAPFVNIKDEEARLIEWATSGAPIPDVPAMMLGGTTPGQRKRDVPVAPPQGVSLSAYASARGVDLAWLRRQVERRPEAPEPAGEGPNRTRLYAWEELDAFVGERQAATS